MLAGENLLSGARQIEPFRTIDLRKALSPPAFRRPFHFEGVALQIVGIAVTLHGPHLNELAARLSCLAESDAVSFGLVPRLLEELASGGRKGILARTDQALGNAPRALILAVPERAAGMAEQNLDASSSAAKEKEPRTLLSG